jgi:hypothetical protein
VQWHDRNEGAKRIGSFGAVNGLAALGELGQKADARVLSIQLRFESRRRGNGPTLEPSLAIWPAHGCRYLTPTFHWQ